MFNKKNQATVTAPQTIEALREQYELDSLRIQTETEKNVNDTESLKLKLGRMSKELYGTENYSEKRSFWPHFWWICALLLVAGVEIPLNAMSFEIFDRPQVETRIMAVVFGLLVATLAHFTGYGFRRSSVGDRTYSTIGFIGLVIAIVAFWTTASFRVQYMEEMGFKSSLSWLSQFAFALIIFGIGVMASYFHTSGVKNLKLEKVFRSEIRRLKSLRKELQQILNKKSKLLKKYTADYNRIVEIEKEGNSVNDGKPIQESREQATERQNVEAEKKSEFDENENKFKEAVREARIMIQSYGNKKTELKGDVSFMQIRARMTMLLQQLEKLSSSADNGQERYKNMENEFNSLNA